MAASKTDRVGRIATVLTIKELELGSHIPPMIKKLGGQSFRVLSAIKCSRMDLLSCKKCGGWKLELEGYNRYADEAKHRCFGWNPNYTLKFRTLPHTEKRPKRPVVSFQGRIP